jgi:nucleoside-diphosphate-sugar epimerase
MELPRFDGVSVLVTGGAGFIGSHLVRGLLGSGAEVLVLDNFSHGMRENLADVAGQVKIMEGDIREAKACAEAVRGRRYVFHLAALGSVPASVDDPVKYNEVNIGGTLNVLEAARQAGVKRVVYSASSAAYGDSLVLPKVETMNPAPKSPYAVTKLVGEYYCQVYAQVYGLSTASLRYFNVFGPRQNPKSQYAAVIPAFLSALAEGRSPIIYGDGEQTRDFCFVRNVVRANMLAALSEQPLAGQPLNIACGERTSLNRMLELMQGLLGTRVAPKYLPVRAGDVRDSLADVRAAGEAIGFVPEVMFAKGLEMTVREWQAGRQVGTKSEQGIYAG